MKVRGELLLENRLFPPGNRIFLILSIELLMVSIYLVIGSIIFTLISSNSPPGIVAISLTLKPSPKKF